MSFYRLLILLIVAGAGYTFYQRRFAVDNISHDHNTYQSTSMDAIAPTIRILQGIINCDVVRTFETSCRSSNRPPRLSRGLARKRRSEIITVKNTRLAALSDTLYGSLWCDNSRPFFVVTRYDKTTSVYYSVGPNGERLMLSRFPTAAFACSLDPVGGDPFRQKPSQ